jgi:hypothetical protein
MPFRSPIVSHEQATSSTDVMLHWRADSEENVEHIGDRVVEVMAYRSVKLWLDTQGPGVGLHSSEPIFVVQPYDKSILAPAVPFSALAARSPHEHEQRGASFFDTATCFNLLGSELAGEWFRQVMSSRFGMPSGTYVINRSPNSWPRPPLWRGVDRVLAVMMSPEHRVRREAGLLRLSTNNTPGAPRPRRL